MLLFQMAARRDAFLSLFPYMLPGDTHDGAPLGAPSSPRTPATIERRGSGT
jgi:hypothetical protein